MGADLEEIVRLCCRLAGSYRVSLLGRGEDTFTLYAEGRACSLLATVSTADRPAWQLAPEEGGWDYLLLAEGEGFSAAAAFKLKFPERHPVLPRALGFLAGFLLARASPSAGPLRGAVLKAAAALSG